MKAIIFDFDGTIADTMPEIWHILNQLGPEFGYKPLSEKEADKLRNLSILQILKTIKFPLWKLPFLVKRTKEELHKIIPSIHPINGMHSVLKQVKKKGYTIGIVTSNSRDSVTKFLEKNNLAFFNFVHAGSSLFGKERKVQKAMQIYQLDVDNTVYVGDEIRDIEAAKKLHMKVIAVTWGFNTKKGLQLYGPDYIIDSPKELLKLL